MAPAHLVSCSSCRDTFLRSLAATQWEKKRRSKNLGRAGAPSSDDVITPSPRPEEEGGGGGGGGGAAEQPSGQSQEKLVFSNRMKVKCLSVRQKKETSCFFLLTFADSTSGSLDANGHSDSQNDPGERLLLPTIPCSLSLLSVCSSALFRIHEFFFSSFLIVS